MASNMDATLMCPIADNRNFSILSFEERLQRWLSPIDPWPIHKASVNTYQQGTLEWFFHDAGYQAWLDGRYRRLSCQGDMGMGKTILMSTIFEKLRAQATPGTAIAVVYCNYGDVSRYTPENILGSILAQLSERIGSTLQFTANLRTAYASQDRQGGMLSPGLQDLRLWLRKEFEDHPHDRHIVLIDGLDELDIGCRRQFLGPLLSILSGRAQLLTTSRPIPDVDEHLQPDLQFPMYALRNDIRKYIASRFGRVTNTGLMRIVRSAPARTDKHNTMETEMIETILENAKYM
jgi:hypothetical protein